MLNESTILRSPAKIAEATTADLIATYNALTGKSIKKFSTRAAGEHQVEMAMLAAKDMDGHTGVPKNSDGKVITLEEAIVKAEARGMTITPPDGDEPARLSFVPGSLADQLDRASIHTAPIVPREKKTSKESSIVRVPVTHVIATGCLGYGRF